jgi:hypothetical protein
MREDSAKAKAFDLGVDPSYKGMNNVASSSDVKESAARLGLDDGSVQKHIDLAETKFETHKPLNSWSSNQNLTVEDFGENVYNISRPSVDDVVLISGETYLQFDKPIVRPGVKKIIDYQVGDVVLFNGLELLGHSDEISSKTNCYLRKWIKQVGQLEERDFFRLRTLSLGDIMAHTTPVAGPPANISAPVHGREGVVGELRPMKFDMKLGKIVKREVESDLTNTESLMRSRVIEVQGEYDITRFGRAVESYISVKEKKAKSEPLFGGIVSRSHFSIRKPEAGDSDRKWKIVDEGSTFGTYIMSAEYARDVTRIADMGQDDSESIPESWYMIFKKQGLFEVNDELPDITKVEPGVKNGKKLNHGDIIIVGSGGIGINYYEWVDVEVEERACLV